MAHVAVPDDDGCIGLDDLECVLAVYWGGHCEAIGLIRASLVDTVARDEAALN